jgi:hypothetical protein
METKYGTIETRTSGAAKFLMGAFSLGRKAREVAEAHEWSEDALFYHWSAGITGLPKFADTPMLDNDWGQAFMAGLRGCEPLPLVKGWRYGRLPEADEFTGCRCSYNYRDQEPEAGVSLMEVDDGPETQDKISAMFIDTGNRPPVRVQGYLLPWRGSDGEPLVICAREIETR